MPSPSTFTQADLDRANAIATELINILANGATAPGNFNWLSIPGTTLPPPLGLPAAQIPPPMVSTFVAAVMAAERLQQSLSVPTVGAPTQIPRIAFASLPSASEWTGSLVLVTDRAPTTGGNGLVAYSDGTNWRKVQDGATVV